MEWKIRVGGNSAPASIAYLYAVPFVIGAFYFKKKLR